MINSVLSLIKDEHPLKIRNELCGHSISSRFHCHDCTEQCSTQSLLWRDSAWELKDCSLCGKCVSVCSNHVFKLDEDFIVQRSKPQARMVLSCMVLKETLPNQFKNMVSDVHCLKQLYPELVHFLLVRSSDIYIYIDESVCQQCHGFDCQQLDEQIKEFGIIPRQIPWVHRVEDLKRLLQGNTVEQIDRRDFFKGLFRRGQTASVEIINEKAADFAFIMDEEKPIIMVGKSEHPEKRPLLAKALKIWRDENKVEAGAVLPYMHLQVDKCNFCGFCTQLCPSNALQIKGEKGCKQLTYLPRDCTGCGLCHDVCLFGQMGWGKRIHVSELLQNEFITLAIAEAKSCPVCDQEFCSYPYDAYLTCADCQTPRHLSPLKRWKYDSA